MSGYTCLIEPPKDTHTFFLKKTGSYNLFGISIILPHYTFNVHTDCAPPPPSKTEPQI